MKTEKQKMLRGEWYDANYAPELLAERDRCRRLCETFNSPAYTDAERDAALHQALPHLGERTVVVPPLHCDYGTQVETGTDCFFNFGATLLDEAPIRFGCHVFVGPDCGFYTAIHPLDAARRNAGLERALPITVEDDVWIGGHVTVLPGVRIGRGSVIGAGSVVTRDVPPGVVAAGNPCRILRKIAEEQRDNSL